jgi:hypothetical protein
MRQPRLWISSKTTNSFMDIQAYSFLMSIFGTVLSVISDEQVEFC